MMTFPARPDNAPTIACPVVDQHPHHCTTHTMKRPRHIHRFVVSSAVFIAALLVACADPQREGGSAAAVDAIDTVVVIYAENRGFDTLYGLFPGADGIPGVNPSAVGSNAPQKYFDGAVLP